VETTGKPGLASLPLAAVLVRVAGSILASKMFDSLDGSQEELIVI